jgi:hypothetical protein
LRFFSINPESFGRLGSYGNRIKNRSNHIIELKTEFLRPFCIVYLDQIIQKEKDSNLKLASTYPNVNQYLKQFGFKHLPDRFRAAQKFPQEKIIRIQRFSGKPLQVEGMVVSWLRNDIIPFMPRLSPDLRKKIVENLWEIVNNGIIHSDSEFGVSAGGQFYPEMGYFEIAFYDAGVGIPQNIRNYGAKSKRTGDSKCIEWAVQEGHSTRPFDESAGLGLHLLREFLNLNGGAFQIVSGNGYFGRIKQNVKEKLTTLRNLIEGTLVNIRVIYDEYKYSLMDE